jgi:hypothetical protein
MLSNDRLPADVRIALIEFKHRIRIGRGVEVFENREGGLPSVAAGQLPPSVSTRGKPSCTATAFTSASARSMVRVALSPRRMDGKVSAGPVVRACGVAGAGVD